MKADEALAETESAVRMALAEARTSPTYAKQWRRRARALRIVLGMARAAQGMVGALEEAASLLDGVRDGSYAPDSFSSQPARTALAAYAEATK